MSKNIKGQCTFAINQCFSEGTDKHSYKSENGNAMTDKIFSYSEKHRLQDMAKSLQNFIKAENIGVKMVKDIKPEHIQKFLDSKVDRCTQNTINTYKETINKLELVLEKVYKIDLKWKDEVATPVAYRDKADDRGADSVITREDYNKLIAYSKDNYSQSGACIILQDNFGVRVEEVARLELSRINLEKGEVEIKGKGGKEYETRTLNPQSMEVIKVAMEKNHHPTKLFSIEGASINAQLRRIEDKLGIERHSNHDIRRLIAQERYDGLRAEGKSPKEALELTSRWLNHGDDRRSMLEKSYVKLS